MKLAQKILPKRETAGIFEIPKIEGIEKRIMINHVLNAVEKKYSDFSKDNEKRTQKRLMHITSALGAENNLSIFEGKKILDIGCGSSDSERFALSGKKETCDEKKSFQPWLCRCLLEAGATPIGIDMGPNENERFKARKMDICRENALLELGESSFDLIHTYYLLPPHRSPYLANHLREKMGKTHGETGKFLDEYWHLCPALLQKYEQSEPLEFVRWMEQWRIRQVWPDLMIERYLVKQIKGQAEELLREGGFYITENKV